MSSKSWGTSTAVIGGAIALVATVFVAFGSASVEPTIKSGKELITELRAVASANQKAIQKLQIEWTYILTSAEGTPVGGIYFGREVWDGAKRYRTGMRGGDAGNGLFIDFAGESAWDGIIGSARVSLSQTVQWTNDTNAISIAGVGGPFEILDSLNRVLGVAPITLGERKSVINAMTAYRDPEDSTITCVDFETSIGITIKAKFDLSKGGWLVQSTSLNASGEIVNDLRIPVVFATRSQGNKIWVPGEIVQVDVFRMPDGSTSRSGSHYKINQETLAVNENVSWSVPFRLYPMAGEKFWDKRLGGQTASTPPSGITGAPGWGYQEMERINTEFWKRNPRPTTQVTSTQPDSGKSTAVSEPTQWMWLIALGAGILLVALGIVIKIRRASV